ncbi:valine--tRNA ligase [Desulfothermobacter acidiphilus]|uniref:valine--tRNA ligase n=1 Tax=Desulfothermobacter acidiphilus TaxID=1938353 RepID=UPI003F893AFF
MAKKALPAAYEPEEVEARWYRFWEEGKFFRGEVDTSRRPFCIVMPPPNVTGELHMGHALDNTLQDVLIRWRRMQGYAALWIPGTDHAGIATQARVEAELAKEGLTRQELGREKFLERVWLWKEKYGNTITKQLRRLGASCDWDRERFTMDEGCSAAVKEVFIRLYEEGLIYRGDYIVNWCPHCQTVISDIEVEHKETPGKLYYIRYPLKEGGFITIATTRPETMLGDTAIAVNPQDPRYLHLIGHKAIVPLVGREIPIIPDEYVDMEFGTGALKVTPAHDPHDFEIAQRHRLPAVQVIGFDARMTEEAGKRYQGLDRWEARKRVVEALKAQNLLEKEEEIIHAVGYCYRCGAVVEPMISKQWFVRMKPLAQPAIAAVEEGRIRFIPERFTKIYLNWVKNIKDWCISRQLWWGHRIPVWHCLNCGQSTVARNGLSQCPHCGSSRVEQDPDVLDTWFSSALWPFSTLGWPQNTPELHFFYPTSVLVTGRDIIFFWVARMIFMGLKFMGEVPFREVFIHGLVLDALGRKMSKSLGNGVDPLEVIESHGADSLRFMLVTGNSPGNDLRFHFERLDGARNFINKLWNASRFVLMNLDEKELPPLSEATLELADRWILSRLQGATERVTAYLEDYELGEAARILYEFIWDEFCDWYIEIAKLRLYGEDQEARLTALAVLKKVLSTCLRLLHPFVPFVTEEIRYQLEPESQPLIIQTWPTVEEKYKDGAAESSMSLLQEVVRSVRHLRAEMRVPPGKRARVIMVSSEEEKLNLLKEHSLVVESLVSGELELQRLLPVKPVNSAHAVAAGVEIYLPLEGLIDVEKERARLQKELRELEEELARVESKLANPSFLAKAPAEVVAKEQSKKEELQKTRLGLEKLLTFLEGVKP